MLRRSVNRSQKGSDSLITASKMQGTIAEKGAEETQSTQYVPSVKVRGWK